MHSPAATKTRMVSKFNEVPAKAAIYNRLPRHQTNASFVVTGAIVISKTLLSLSFVI